MNDTVKTGGEDRAALDAVEKRCWRDLVEVAVPDAVEDYAVELAAHGPVQASVVAQRPEAEMANQILGAAEAGAVTEGHLADAVEWMESRVDALVAKRLVQKRSNGTALSSLAQAPAGRVDPGARVDYLVHVTPGLAGTEAAEDWLGRHGFEAAGSWARLLRDGSAPAFRGGEELQIIELALEQSESMFGVAAESMCLERWAESWFYELPDAEGWHCYFALDPPSGHAFATTLIEDGSASFGRTPDVGSERRHAQLALLRRRILDASLAGCHTLFADAPEAGGRELLLEAGFEDAYSRRVWRPVRSREGAGGIGDLLGIRSP